MTNENGEAVLLIIDNRCNVSSKNVGPYSTNAVFALRRLDILIVSKVTHFGGVIGLLNSSVTKLPIHSLHGRP